MNKLLKVVCEYEGNGRKTCDHNEVLENLSGRRSPHFSSLVVKHAKYSWTKIYGLIVYSVQPEHPLGNPMQKYSAVVRLYQAPDHGHIQCTECCSSFCFNFSEYGYPWQMPYLCHLSSLRGNPRFLKFENLPLLTWLPPTRQNSFLKKKKLPNFPLFPGYRKAAIYALDVPQLQSDAIQRIIEDSQISISLLFVGSSSLQKPESVTSHMLTSPNYWNFARKKPQGHRNQCKILWNVARDHNFWRTSLAL